MNSTLNPIGHHNSPLAQARRAGRVSLQKTSRPLSGHQQATLKAILDAEKYDYIHDETFDLPHDEAERVIYTDADDVPKPDTSWYHPVMDNYQLARASKSVGTVLLTAKQERVIFLQYNYARHRVAELKAELEPQADVDVDRARELLRWHARAELYRDQIANTNLALVLAMAKRTRMSEVDFADLVSEGNMALLRAVDKFDVARGFKFSTYACRAILKAFSRAGVKLSKHRSMFPTDFDPKLERSDHMETKRAEHEDDCVDEIRRILKDNKAELSEIEKEVIEHRFKVGKQRPAADEDTKPLTLEQVGKIIGVTKERVRQIQNKALEKIRVSLEGDFLG